MDREGNYDVQHLRSTPAGYHVRTVRAGGHLVRVAFPPGPRRTGTGVAVEVLHPRGENPGCRARRNPMELLVMGANPLTPGEKKELEIAKQDLRMPKQMRDVMGAMSPEQARIVIQKLRRKARQNPMEAFTEAEKMHLISLGTKTSEIRTAADVRKARRELKKYDRLRASNPFAGRRRNPSGVADVYSEEAREAQQLWKGFTEDTSENFTVENEPHIPHGNYALLGKLEKLRILPAAGQYARLRDSFWHVPEMKNIRVIAAVNRRQIFFAGGDQAISDEALRDRYGAGSENMVLLGTCVEIAYIIRKYHQQIPAEDRGHLVAWHHEFGEVSGVKPTLFYDRAIRRLLLSGGDYTVKDEGIVN